MHPNQNSLFLFVYVLYQIRNKILIFSRVLCFLFLFDNGACRHIPNPIPGCDAKCSTKLISKFSSKFSSKFTSKFTSKFSSKFISKFTSKFSSKFISKFISKFSSKFSSMDIFIRYILKQLMFVLVCCMIDKVMM